MSIDVRTCETPTCRWSASPVVFFSFCLLKLNAKLNAASCGTFVGVSRFSSRPPYSPHPPPFHFHPRHTLSFPSKMLIHLSSQRGGRGLIPSAFFLQLMRNHRSGGRAVVQRSGDGQPHSSPPTIPSHPYPHLPSQSGSVLGW